MIPWVTCYLYPLEQSSSLGSCGIRREVGMTQTYPLNSCKSGPAGRLNLSPNLFLPFHMPSVPADANLEGAIHEVHILADASEQAYGVVAYTRTEVKVGQIHLSFILAHLQVAPRRLHSIPRLELCLQRSWLMSSRGNLS